jgi:hypothetical protein
MSGPEESVLTSIQELVNAYAEDKLTVAIEKCNSLLKRRKTLDSDIADAVQRLLLQCYIQQKDYSNVREYGRKYPQQHKDLVLYAHYRQDEFDVVSQQASKSSSLEQHLLAQSYYHLNQVNPAIRVYQEMLNDNTLDEERRMEVLTNALSVFSATVVPYVNNRSPLLEQAQAFLEKHPHSYSDLSLNVGTLQCLTASPPSSPWLDAARDLCGDENPDDLIPVEINTQWSRQFWQTDTNGTINYEIEGSAPQKAVAQLNQGLLDHRPLVSQPHPKWNSLQVQLYWYNRAVQQYQTQKYVECQESCQSLRKTFGNKRKGLTSPADWWWQSRVDVLLAHVQKEQAKVDAGITRLEERWQELQKQESCNVIDHATAYIQLHLHALQHPKPSNEDKKALLKSLPASIQLKPAVVATLETLERAIGSKGKVSTSSPTDEANVMFNQAQYAEAAKLYEANLPSPESCDQQQLALQLKRVQALALCGEHDASTELFESLIPLLDNAVEDPSSMVNGENLENKALPRSSTSKSLVVAVAPGEESKPKRSMERILRQRAHKREAYLKSLEEKGQYNPDQPAKPDAERWIPKHERSRARRRGQNSRSAQGGGSQADALKLDAAARRAGHVSASTGPSTANLKVSSGGRKARGRR